MRVRNELQRFISKFPLVVLCLSVALVLWAWSFKHAPFVAIAGTKALSGSSYILEATLPANAPEGIGFESAIKYVRNVQKGIESDSTISYRQAENIVFKFYTSTNSRSQSSIIMSWPMPYFAMEGATVSDEELVGSATEVKWLSGYKGEREVMAFCKSQETKTVYIAICTELKAAL